MNYFYKSIKMFSKIQVWGDLLRLFSGVVRAIRAAKIFSSDCWCNCV